MVERTVVVDGFSNAHAMTGWRLGFGIMPEELANLLLDEAGVALLPGTAFGTCGEGYLRLSYAASIGDIEQALEGMYSEFERLAE